VTTATNGAGELITPGREGFVVPAADAVSELAGALDRLADDEARARMSAAAIALGREQSFDRHLGRLIELCEEVAAQRSGGVPGCHVARRGDLASRGIA
jgi:UDP-glucose:(heptosyl)LPS alpha-1,3-glucosyltransferase